jgi:hypothetical protein
MVPRSMHVDAIDGHATDAVLSRKVSLRFTVSETTSNLHNLGG